MGTGVSREKGEREERAERAALCSLTEKEKRLSGSSEMTISQETTARCEMEMKTEEQRQLENIKEVVSTRRLRTSQQHKTEERSEIPQEEEVSLETFWDCFRVPNWECSGGELEDSYCRYSRNRRRYRDEAWPQDARSEGENCDWTTEGTAKKERKVEEDPGLQSSKRGSAGKAFQDGFPGESGGTPGGERLDDNSGYIECIPTCQGGRAIQSLSALHLTKSMLCSRWDAIWSER
ncbi:uncharacterized protein MONOS_8835 [Monocercomonoides exilis]|uniref:uncharacterized protein n=1 Tax=Monocercomonoides exilis TaxID=2049356 RepID=UPI003559A96B|nr:hypothetical protein MONOS_8835 [Monocercomonoides exilis]|eukprot:MONOS_8835.1-p1 / transcript=MONOS_8835.1 / gene=MONOS_8835 / organism=Monocercomonoides_exilis_PA203 / gene_product=unspecified product / transcript_product=unspecified product / location=Mono_scaffold00344:53944-55004(+) / protein_length=235 / sequence_SO=supercontig / SO=protein_coding / is_pseudo=false